MVGFSGSGFSNYYSTSFQLQVTNGSFKGTERQNQIFKRLLPEESLQQRKFPDRKNVINIG